MRNLARAITTAGVALAVGLIGVPSASAVVKEAGKAAAAAKSSAPAKKASASSTGTNAVEHALASKRPVTVNIYYVLHDGRVVSEQGPGDSAAHEVDSNTGAIDMQTQNESIRTGDLEAEENKGDVTFEVEGSEQDTGEVS